MLPLKVILCASTVYLLVGTIIYLVGHPKLRYRIKTDLGAASKRNRPDKMAGRSVIYRHLAHCTQIVNFVFNKISRPKRPTRFASVSDAYAIAVRRAFDPHHQSFITTGSPHARACYPRNFAWFYPTLLDRATIIDSLDFENRTTLIVLSLETILKVAGTAPYTTTLIPLTRQRMSAVNYVTPPSDSLLGIFAGIEQLVGSGAPRSAGEGARLLEEYGADLRTQTHGLIGELKEITVEGTRCSLLDTEQNRSSATDTRGGRLRFVVAANVWATIAKAVRLGIIDQKSVCERLGCDLPQYKRSILKLFGRGGYIRNSLDPDLDERESSEITLDFAHVHRGFWDFSTEEEIRLFQATADRIFADSAFADASGDTFFVSRGWFYYRPMYRYTVPGYHGRTVWPNFNVAFTERLLAFAAWTENPNYRRRAERILRGVKSIVEKNGAYPELVDEKGKLYKTWIYRSALADSWFPYFASVWHEAFGSLF
jgi:hypothetical protein